MFIAKAELYYFGYRFYSPNLQRWLNCDTIGEKGGINLYKFANNSPTSTFDVGGMWPSGAYGSENVHGSAISEVLGKTLSKQDIQWLIAAQTTSDAKENQMSARSCRHAMRDGEHGQSVEEARREANNFVREMLTKAQQAQRDGNRQEAMGYLGIAMHVLQDSTSPAHSGFQPWDEHSKLSAMLEHVSEEDFNPKAGSQLYKATQDAYGYFSGTIPIPKDFFIYTPDQRPPQPGAPPAPIKTVGHPFF
jgi:hypothetical protein